MLFPIESKTKQYCHYGGFGVWRLNQIYGEPNPRYEIIASVILGMTQEGIGLYITKLDKNNTHHQVSIEKQVIIPRGVEEIDTGIKLISPNIDQGVKLILDKKPRFNLEILNYSQQPPVSRIIHLDIISLPEIDKLNNWPGIDSLLRSYINQEENS